MIPYAKEYQEKIDKENESDYGLEFPDEKKIKWHHHVLLNRPSKVVIVMFLTAVICPVIIYQFVFLRTADAPVDDGYSTGSCLVARSDRIPCGNINQNNSSKCDPQCCYDLEAHLCYHRYPSRFTYILDRQWDEEVKMYPRIDTVPYGSQKSLTRLRMSINEVSSTHMSLSFYNANTLNKTGSRIEKKLYSYNIKLPEFDIEVSGPQGILFSTMRGPLIASENIWEVAFKLTNEALFGLGEIPLKQTSKVIYSHKGGLSSVPLIFAKLNGSYHGILIDIDAPTEISVFDGNHILVRSITNQGLTFHIFVGPEPKDIMYEVISLIGKVKIEYWMLGAHICSDQDGTWATMLTNLQNFLRDANREVFPYESHCGLTPMVMEETCEATPAQVATAIRQLGNYNKKFIPHVSAYIKHNVTILQNDTSCTTISGHEDQFLFDPQTGNVYNGLVGSASVFYPSYESENVTDILNKMWIYDVTFDGIVLENTWPLDESFKLLNETYFELPYFNENFEYAFTNTIFWNISHANDEKHLYRHNQYGNEFSAAFKNITGDIPTLSTSQWMNGNLGINRQSINTTWLNLHTELIEAAMGGISGHWYWSTPICGDSNHFNLTLHAELCGKWYLAGAFMPHIKIHSSSTGRDPLTFTGTIRATALSALQMRQNLMPYFFTVLQDGPLLRPMFYQYPHDEALIYTNSQFMVGTDLLIIPNLISQQSHVHFTMPPGNWFEIWSGVTINGKEGHVVTMTTTQTELLTLIRGGSIIALQKGYKTSADTSRLQLPYSLTIALYIETLQRFDIIGLPLPPDTKFEAEGNLFIAENMTIKFSANNETLTIEATGNNFTTLCGTGAVSIDTINEVNIYGLYPEYNNFDHHRRLYGSISLCDLETNDKIYIDLLENELKPIEK